MAERTFPIRFGSISSILRQKLADEFTASQAYFANRSSCKYRRAAYAVYWLPAFRSRDHTDTMVGMNEQPFPTPILASSSGKAARRRTGKGDWIPDQPGAWAMALLPAIAGVVIAGPGVDTIWLLVAWIICYCVQFSAARWLKSRCSPRYLPPALVYTVALAIVGVPFLITHAGILRWAPLYIVLAAASMAAAWLRKERSLWGNTVAVIAASTMTVVIDSFTPRPQCTCLKPVIPVRVDASTSLSCNPDTVYAAVRDMPAIERLFDLQAWWPEGALPPEGLVATLLFAVTQFGSVLFVKTMIRERGKRGWLWASWIWHGALFATAMMFQAMALNPMHNLSTLLTLIAAAALLARAIALPLVARTRTIKPMIVGVTECFSSLLVFGCIIAVVM
ncbi:YwiC-like family protein [Bifidobacterium sp. UTBIF-78]|uniref:YwiC-like family protein n=1 Tax=Bifidobacterium sp. UTBIF-78 TaxID=1465263 RepID=UPI0021596E66|nr:YwiC-like family protein [Bifidobacterium sp. UTBIF-78]